MRIVQISRKRNIKTKSIENLFASINREISVSVDQCELPFCGDGLINRLRNLLFVFRMRKSYDIFHIVGDCYYVSCALLGKKLLITFHDLVRYRSFSGLLKKAVYFVFWVFIPVRLSNKVVFISNSSMREHLEIISINHDKVEVIKNCLSLSSFAHPKKVNFSKTFVSKFKVLIIGTKSNKNLTNSVIAASEINDVVCFIVGDLSTELSVLIEKFPHSIVWLGRITDHELYSYYLSCDVLLFASFAEGFGLPILEAQYFGLPVVTSNLSSMPEVASSTGAIFCDPYNVESIKSALLIVKTDYSLRKSLVEFGRENAYNFSSVESARRYEHIYFSM